VLDLEDDSELVSVRVDLYVDKILRIRWDREVLSMPAEVEVYVAGQRVRRLHEAFYLSQAEPYEVRIVRNTYLESLPLAASTQDGCRHVRRA